ncbi:Cytosolic carboxypeptidase 2 [Monoraphidium neglectum]|uniref:Cytosolic carboxypeptidase 2 n=1 Tax=Monoraphidium neglectum TaxID=145388 RepID=A0A0D2JLJ8_9CHLO|nr:Cytosolic carboxypeptidase 2 [Monoraphidium neglectum]KIZ00098.1 Cytosolic carboxypeptidase 2 [Monoraphidium neglectum]|eukprot:XP_013899117.1 Cytosolic carboxypeptidase 2 [Monoraphidium neglectum]
MLSLKGRPKGGAGPAEFGPAHSPGRLARPNGLPDSQIQNLPARAGTGLLLPPPRTHEASCAPPPLPEPLAPAGAADAARAEAALRDAARVSQPDDLLLRLVYDGLVPPEQPPPAQLPGSFCKGPEAGSGAGSGASSGVGSSAGGGPRLDYAPGLEAWYVPDSPDDTTLVFESRFECGNLRRAIQVRQYEYDLVLQPDINTRGHTQWGA